MLAVRGVPARGRATRIGRMRTAVLRLLVAVALASAALLAVEGSLSDPARWTPDGLFYQARSLELRGMDRDTSLERVFGGPLGAELRTRDPDRSGNPEWVRYNAQFYERRVAVPAAAAALEPVGGERTILDISLAGYVATVLAVFALLLLRFRLSIAAAVTAATIVLPALTSHSSFPLTDSWGLALETAAFAAAILVLDRGPRWLFAWAAVILALSFTRDSTWVPILASGFLILNQRSRLSLALFGTGVAAAVPALLAFSTPVRELMAMMLNDIRPAPEASWGFIAERWPGAMVDLVQANGGFVRDGAWYSAAYLAVGVCLLFLLARGPRGSSAATLLKGGVIAGLAYLTVVPVFSAFRLELVFVPMAAFGLALGAERLAEALAPQLAKVRIRLNPRAREASLT